MTYLDYAATSFPKSEAVCENMNHVMRTLSVNAGRGGYRLACQASKIIEETRKMICQFMKADDVEQVIFSPSATIAANQVLFGLDWKKDDIVMVSYYEHNAIMRPLRQLEKEKGIRIKYLSVKEDTKECDINQIIYDMAEEPPKVVCMTQISNVTGYRLPLEKVFSEAKKYGAVTIADGAQGFGVVPTSLAELGADIYLFAGHKSIGGPFGVGGFINYGNVPLKGFLFGGNGSDSRNLELPDGGPLRYEVGSENVVAIAGLQVAMQEALDTDIGIFYVQEQKQTSYLREQLKKCKKVTLYPENVDNDHYVGIVSFSVRGFTADEIGKILDEDFDIAVRTGYHCAPKVHDIIGSVHSGGTVRVSVGKNTTQDDLDALADAVWEICE